MKPEEALQILDTAASQAKANRADHVAIQQAVQVLLEKITPKPKKTAK